jgi:hypothetical protein
MADALIKAESWLEMVALDSLRGRAERKRARGLIRAVRGRLERELWP